VTARLSSTRWASSSSPSTLTPAPTAGIRPQVSRAKVSQSRLSDTDGASVTRVSTLPRPSASTRTVRMNSSGPLTSKTTVLPAGAPASLATAFGSISTR